MAVLLRGETAVLCVDMFQTGPFPLNFHFRILVKLVLPFSFPKFPIFQNLWNQSSFWLSDQIFDRILSEGPRVSLTIFSHGLEYSAVMLHFTHSVNLLSQCNLSFIDWVSLLMILDLFHRPVTVTSRVTPCSWWGAKWTTLGTEFWESMMG